MSLVGVEFELTEPQRARVEALRVARSVLEARGFIAASTLPSSVGDLVVLADYILAGSGPVVGDLLDDGGDGELEVGDRAFEEFPSAHDMAVRIRDLVKDLRSKYGQGVELGAGGVERVDEILTGHGVSPSVDGQALDTPGAVGKIVGEATDISSGVGGVAGRASARPATDEVAP